jgi:endo-1,4-beta-mannosidase
MWEMRNADRALVEKPKQENTFEDLGRDMRIILKWVLINRMGGHGLHSVYYFSFNNFLLQ